MINIIFMIVIKSNEIKRGYHRIKRIKIKRGFYEK